MAVSLNSSGAVIAPESLAAANVIFVQNFVAEVLHNAFPHLTQLQIKVTVEADSSTLIKTSLDSGNI